MVSANGDSKFVLPVTVVQGDGVEGCYGGWKFSTASTENRNEVPSATW